MSQFSFTPGSICGNGISSAVGSFGVQGSTPLSDRTTAFGSIQRSGQVFTGNSVNTISGGISHKINDTTTGSISGHTSGKGSWGVGVGVKIDL